MRFKIVVDSCCDLPDYLETDPHIVKVPLTIRLDDTEIIDDENFDQLDFIKRVAASAEGPQTACPSPDAYKEAYRGEAEAVYVVTLSAQLSGSYNSAVLGMNLYYEEYGHDKEIYVFNSCSACCGEGQVTRRILELAQQGMPFAELVPEVEEFRYGLNTYFVIETLETLRKNGRLSNLQAIMAGVLNIKPVMGATKEGLICKLGQARGIEKALQKMIETVITQVVDAENKILMITECNCRERAEWVREKFRRLGHFKDILITKAGGISTVYANDGGIVVVV